MARAKRNRTASRTPARDRLVAALRRKGGEVRQAEACRLAGVSSSTAARAAAAGAVIRIKKGRAVYLTVPVQAAAVTVRAATHGPAVKGVPGGRLDAMARLLAGRGSTPRERAADFLLRL